MIKAKLTDRTTQVRLFRFIFSGLTVMGVQVGCLALLTHWWNRSLAFIVSYAFAVLVHYSLNRFWALKSKRTDVARQAGEYAITVLASFVTSFSLFTVASSMLSLSPVWAAILTNPPTTIAVFLVLNFRVFRA